MKLKIEIDLNDELINEIISDNIHKFEISKEEVIKVVTEFVSELNDGNGLREILDSLDYFNY